MTHDAYQGRQPQFKLTVSLLGVALACIWFVTLYTSQAMREDLRRTLGDQQFSTASIIATQVNGELQDRLNVLTTVSGRLRAEILPSAAGLQTFLQERTFLPQVFNGGVFITGADGTALADFPVVPGRVGTNYMDRESISIPLKEGKSVIGRPNMGKTLKAPIFSIVVPIRNAKGAVIGSIAGTVNLGLPNFLDKLAVGRYGKTDGYLLIAPQYRLVITASDKRRVMETLPASGVIPAMDRMLGGYEGTDIFVNARGVEVMNSGVTIPVSGWRTVVSVPTSEAFESIEGLQQRVMLAATIATLLACALTWWLLSSQRSAELAYYDPLTQLANRRLMEDRLSQTMASSRRSGTYFAVMVLDLDNFKPLNDKHGHMAGDLLLIEASNRLKRSVRDIDTVARFGGDEFAVILGELDAAIGVATSQVSAVAEKIRASLAEPYLLTITQRGKADAMAQHHCTVSIGVALAMDHEANQDDIVKWADAAMYQAKHAGRNAIRFYEVKGSA